MGEALELGVRGTARGRAPDGHRLVAWLLTGAVWALAALRSGFGLVPVCRRSLSAVPSAPGPLPSRPTALLFRLIFLVRALGGRNDLLVGAAGRYVTRARRELETAGSARTAAGAVEALPGMPEGPEAFRRTFLDRPRPVVLRGAHRLARDWSLRGLIGAFGDSPVLMSEPSGFALAPLAELPARSARGAYVANSEQLLFRHPELVRDLDVDALRELTGRTPYVAQLFVGARPGSGLTFHCANNLNLFTMLHGRKRWTFVDPAFSYWMYPWVTRESAYVASVLDHDEIAPDALDLFDFCPRQEVVLEPGDVLVSPRWWWHRVENLDADTVGAASRWADPFGPETNRLFSAAQLPSSGLVGATVETLHALLRTRGSLRARYQRDASVGPSAIERIAHTREQLLPGSAGRQAWGIPEPDDRDPRGGRANAISANAETHAGNQSPNRA